MTHSKSAHLQRTLRNAFTLAKEAYKHTYIYPEHFLLAAMDDPEVQSALAEQGGLVERIRVAATDYLSTKLPAYQRDTSTDPDYAPFFAAILAAAERVAMSGPAPHPTTAVDVIREMLAEPDVHAVKLLRDCGLAPSMITEDETDEPIPIFLSYSTADKDRLKLIFRQLADRYIVLMGRPADVGLDDHPNARGIQNDTWRSELEKMLGCARAIVGFWSRSAKESRHVESECHRAERDHKLVLVKIDPDVELPSPFDVYQYIALDPDGHSPANLKPLFRAIEGKVRQVKKRTV